MTALTLDAAQTILSAALAAAAEKGFKPLAVALVDARGALKAFAAQDGTSLKRGEIALGKANGALALGLGSRAIARMAVERPHFIAAATQAVGGSLVPVPGGVLVREATGELVGAVGVSGDTSDNDETAAVAGIRAAGLTPDTGEG
ncbi:heme-binding protein [Chelatococcus sp. SYSU_G07232]|uniref:Heme-binding protein n=1 Tax=Chelatococcus albus TaxID=3047466 RepID=A0ABT7AIC5_9HYPH|nr:heme-binding protein [Chelatococcus sp. SYSU_G07232]MDJ1159124.1 heme-binding protein [Chelatococcus sp. SYSU_G07232]